MKPKMEATNWAHEFSPRTQPMSLFGALKGNGYCGVLPVLAACHYS